MRGADDGFTLIEMMVVIAVMGLLLSLVLTHGPHPSPVLNLRAAAGDVARNLRLAGSTAIADDRAMRFIADPAQRRYGIAGRLETLPAGIDLSVAAPNGNIVFEPDGSASAATIRLRTGHWHQDVAVNWVTGQVSIGRMAADGGN